ncbi:helix-turn-helix domain-containing protein, partial [Desulfosporosinus sp. SYSU MS00001]|uniref:helix-turn-helix domain-containing protein n=1 Tax=Desulfosporosinus sp. SYSU MS00001 TaxID=3416284 RepID=UPI003CF20BA6
MRELLKPAQKLCNLRESLGVTQDAFQCDGLSRGHYCRLEKEKRNITADTARIIIRIANEIAEEKELDILIPTVEYLLESNEYQANRILLENYYVEITTMIKSEEEYNLKKAEIEEFINKYDNLIYNHTKSKIQYGYAKALWNLNLLDKSERQYYSAYSYSSKVDDYETVIRLLNLKAHINCRTNRDSEIMNLYLHALDLAVNNKILDDELISNLYYN